MSDTPEPQAAFTDERRAYWDAHYAACPRGTLTGRPYRRRLARLTQHLVMPGLRVLEIGCGRGDLLAAVSPARGVGIDLSERAVALAREAHPELEFRVGDAHALDLDETFDVVILSDLVNELWDVQRVLHEVRRVTTPRSRIVLNSYSHLWQVPLACAKALGLARPVLDQNWLAPGDIVNLFELEGFEVVRRRSELLWPLWTPLLEPFLNRYVAKLWPFRLATQTNFFVARPRPEPEPERAAPVVSVVVPARNEAGNIERIFERTPEMGAGTELVFVEGNSTDDTFDAIEAAIARHPERRCKLLRQTGKGKGDAVRLGFAEASGDVFMILDADVTVAPEMLPRFLEALEEGRGEFINGVRLVYPMGRRAMRFFNLIGNKFFSGVFTWLLGQPIKDCLCGTKVLRREDYARIAAGRSYFGDFDPFGDFDLIFGAARLNLKIVDLPIRYGDRTYGTTNINRWRHGVILLRMVLFAANRMKFI